MKARTPEEIKERIQLAIIEEINVINLIGQVDASIWIPMYIQNLTEKISEITLDEIEFRRKRY